MRKFLICLVVLAVSTGLQAHSPHEDYHARTFFDGSEEMVNPSAAEYTEEYLTSTSYSKRFGEFLTPAQEAEESFYANLDSVREEHAYDDGHEAGVHECVHDQMITG